jgi:hypothetical protein
MQQRGSAAAQDCDAKGAEVILKGMAGPTIQLDAFASAGVGGEILGIGAEAGIRGDLTLIKVEPTAGIDSAVRLSDSRQLDDVQLQVFNVFAIPVQYMNGRI